MLRELDDVVLPLAFLLTSLGAYLLARCVFRLDPRRLGAAVRTMLECFGLTAAFFVLNIAVGAAVVHALRLLPVQFVALYAATDMILLPLSLVQALVFHGWRAAAAPPAGTA